MSTPNPQNPAFCVAPRCVQLGLRAGAILCEGVQIRPSDERVKAETSAAIEMVRDRFAKVADIGVSAEVAAYREVLRAVGPTAQEFKPSVESLLQFVFARGRLPVVNNLVDLYNAISIRTLTSVGAHDVAQLTFPVELRFLRQETSFVPLGRGEAVDVPAGEYAYFDASARLLCRLDVLQADFSKVTAAAERVLVIVEGTAAHTNESLAETFHLCATLIPEYCGGRTTIIASPLDELPGDL